MYAWRHAEGGPVINAAGLQTDAIVVSIRSEDVEEFERLFAAEELPIWDEFQRSGTLVSASLTRVEYGSQQRDGVQDYVIVAVFHGMSGHTAHDGDARFNAFLAKARTFQPSSPYVWGGTTLHARPGSVADRRLTDEG
jgi:hypothetical protein